MSWFDSAFKYRYPVAVENSTGVGNYDINIVVSSDFDTFWDNIGSNGFDVIPVSPFGNLIAFTRSVFNYTNRQLTLSLDSVELANASVNYLYIYFKKSDSIDQSSVVTISSPKAGQIYLGKPRNMIVGPSTFVGGASSPAQSFVMNTLTSAYVWFEFNHFLANRFSPYNDKMSFEDVLSCKVDVVDSGGSSVAGMYNLQKTRFVPGFVGAYIQGSGGSDGNDYQIRISILTTQEQTITLTAQLQIRNQLP